MKLAPAFGKLFLGLVCCGHVLVLAMACMLTGSVDGGLAVVVAVGLSQVGLTALFASLGSWPFIVRVPAWAMTGTVPLITIWIAIVHVQPDGYWLGVLAAFVASWVSTVFVLTVVRWIPLVRWHLAYLGDREGDPRSVHKQFSLLQLFILVAAFGCVLQLVHQLIRMPCPWGLFLEEAYRFRPNAIVIVVSITTAVHVTAGLLLLATRGWAVWLGFAIYTASLVALWAFWEPSWLCIGIWLTSIVVTLLAIRACGTRWIAQRHAATIERDDPLPTTRAQSFATLAQDPTTIALCAVCGLSLWLTCSGSLVTCRLVLANCVEDVNRLWFRDIRIDLQNVPREKLPLSRLRQIHRLNRLNLHGAGITDSDLQYIKDLTYLETLDLSSTNITDQGLSSLRQLPNLWQLQVEDTHVTFSGVCQFVRHVPSLDHATWKRGESTEAYWRSYGWPDTRYDAPFPSVFMRVDWWKDRCLALSGDCPAEDLRLVKTLRIKHLCFSRGRLTRDACEMLPSLTNVESVTLWDVHGAGIAAKYLTKMPSLTGLELVGQTVHDNVFSELGNLTQLETLGIGRSERVPDLSALRGLTSLKALTLADTPVSDISPLAELTNLESLELRQTQVTDLTPLASLPKLRELIIEGVQVTDLTPLAKMPKLEQLLLGDTQPPAQEIQRLQKALPSCRIESH